MTSFADPRSVPDLRIISSYLRISTINSFHLTTITTMFYSPDILKHKEGFSVIWSPTDTVPTLLNTPPLAIIPPILLPFSFSSRS
jgi:hypothetical protein